MNGKNSRRTFFKVFLSLSAFGAGSLLSFKRNRTGRFEKLELVNRTHAMDNSLYAMSLPSDTIRIQYFGMSCFLITTSNATRIITDPFRAGGNILHPELRHEPADIVTVSCGHYAHCYVSDVGGFPYVFKRSEPAEIKGITFRGVASRHLEMEEASRIRPDGENFITCFEVEGIKICHLGALGYKLTDKQVGEIGKVDILMVPVGGVSTLPVKDANDACRRLNPRIILPMHYGSDRCTIASWATVDDFLEGKENSTKLRGLNEMLFKLSEFPSETKIIALGYPS